MTSRQHHLTYLLFFIYLLALPASVYDKPLGCDWLKNPEPNPGKPELNSTIYEATVAPDVPVGTLILKISGNDTDVNDTLLYFLEDCDYVEFIDLDPIAGELKVISSLMNIYALEIQCVVRVQDRDNLTDPTVKTDRADLIIKIFDIRDFDSEDWIKTSWEDEYDYGAQYRDISEQTTTAVVNYMKLSENNQQTTKPSVTYTPTDNNKTQTTKKPIITYTPAPNNKTQTTKKPRTNVGKTTTVKLPSKVNQTGKGVAHNATLVPKAGGAKKNKTMVVRKVKKPGYKEGETAQYEYVYEYEYDYTDDGAGGETSSEGGKGAQTGYAKEKKRVRVGGKGGAEVQSQEYDSYEGGVGGSSEEEGGRSGSRGHIMRGRGRERGRKGHRVRGGYRKGGRKQKGTGSGYNGSRGKSWETTARSRNKKGGNRRTHRKRHRLGENSNSSEEIGSASGFYSYSFNGSNNNTSASYRQGGSEKGYKRKHGYKYKGGKRHGHGENYTSSEVEGSTSGYYSYSYNGTGDDTSGSYSRGSNEKAYKRKHGYKYKSGKIIGHGENSTSSEEEGSTSGYYSYSYNETDDDSNGSYRKEDNKMSNRLRGGIKYNPRKRGQSKGGHSTYSEVDGSRSGLYNYNGIDGGTSVSYGKDSEERDNEEKNNMRYKGRKRGYRRGRNFISSEGKGSRSGYLSYSINGTRNETLRSDGSERNTTLFKHRGRHGNGGKGETSSMKGARHRRRGKYRKGGKFRNKNVSAGEISGEYSYEELNYGSGEFGYNGSATTVSGNAENGNSSQTERNRGKKYRSGKNRVSGKYRKRKTNRGEQEGFNSNATLDNYEDVYYDDYEEYNETDQTQHSNNSESTRVQGQKYKTGKHRLGGNGNGTEGDSVTNYSETGADEYYYNAYYETYEDSNSTETYYDLGADEQTYEDSNSTEAYYDLGADKQTYEDSNSTEAYYGLGADEQTYEDSNSTEPYYDLGAGEQTYEDSNSTETYYNLGAEEQEMSSDQEDGGTQAQGIQSSVAPQDESSGSGGTAQENAGPEKSATSQLETSSGGGSGYWKEEWTESPTYGEYFTWEEEYEGEEYEVTDQPSS